MREARPKPTHRLTIRRAVPGDLRRILEIEKASFPEDAWDARLFRSYLADSRAVFLIATRGPRTLGYAVAVHRDRRGELDSIAVAPSARGKNVGMLLLRRLLERLGRRGAMSVTLMVRIENASAIRLYRKLGFVRERRVNGYYEDGSPAWRMRVVFCQREKRLM